MAIEKKELEYAKELDDVLVLVVELIKVIKKKGDYTSLVDELVNAITGMEQIPAEISHLKPLLTTVGHRSGELVEIFVKKA